MAELLSACRKSVFAPLPNPGKPISSFFDSHRTPADFPAGVLLSICLTAEADS